MTRARLVAGGLRLLPGVVALALGVYAYRIILVVQGPFHADEAGHALPAARMAMALRHVDLAGFLETTRQDILWPFFHPLVVSVFFLLGGIARDVARSSSLCAFVAVVGLVPLLARELALPPVSTSPTPKEPERATLPPTLGWLSATALMAAPALWGFSCSVMTESLGMLMTVATLICAARADRRQSARLHLATGVLAAFTFFTKYNYGVPLVAALFVTQAWRTRARGWRGLAAYCAGAGVPLVVWLVFVFGSDRSRLGYLWDYVRVNRDEGIHGLDAALFYPRGVIEVFGLAVAVAMAMGLVGVVLRRPSDARVASLIFVSLTLGLLLPHPNKQWRYLAPALPVLLGLAEAGWALWLRRVQNGLLWALPAVCLLVVRQPLDGIREDAREAGSLAEAGPILRFAAQHVPPDRPVLVLGSSGLLPHIALSWELLERDRREPDVDLMLFPSADGWDARFRSGYPPEMRPEYATLLAARLATTKAIVVAFELGGHSPFLPDWMARWDAWAQNYPTLMKTERGYALTAERAFPASDAVVRIYDKAAP
jgi:hypothetical protein